MITSVANDRVKYVRSLHRRSVRHRERQFIVEGLRLVEEMKEAGHEPAFVFHTEAFADRPRGRVLVDTLRASKADVVVVSEHVMQAVADTKTPQGIVAVLPFPEISSHESSLILVLDRLRDPGNLGTILRSAEASGTQEVISVKGTVDVFSPKVVRAAMGAHFRLPILYDCAWDEVEGELGGRQIFVAQPAGKIAYYEVDWTRPSSLIVGEEAHGVGVAARRLATGSISIPMRATAESLNVAVAASIILFEAARQRARQGF
jgi:TrmH family RNA methyltransferase